MKTKYLLSIISFVLLFQFNTSTLPATAHRIKDVIAYAQVTGAQQGNFTGSARTPGFQGQIALVGIDDESNVEGLSKLMIQKYPDASSSQFQAALSHNEILTRVFIQVVKNVIGQPVPKTYQTYTLVNAVIQNIGTTDGYEVIRLNAAKITVGN